jgi:hypothetical protein
MKDVKTKKIRKQRQTVASYDDNERSDYLKNKFGSKQRRRKMLIANKEKRLKDEKRQEKAEVRKEKKEQLEKYAKIFDEHEKLVKDYDNKKLVSDVKTTNNQKIKVTVNFLNNV